MSRSSIEPEDFEDNYTARLEMLLAGHGLRLKHHRDRVGIDLGLQLQRLDGSPLSHIRVWFQLKGKHTSTLPVEEFDRADSVSLDLDRELVRFWNASPEPVFLCVYIQSADCFIAADIRDMVEQRFGPNGFVELADLDQQTVRLHVPTSARLDEAKLNELKASAGSMRIDGPSFRGRPLAHRMDPLRSSIAAVRPPLFHELIEALLQAHNFRLDQTLPMDSLVEADSDPGDARLLIGTLYNTWDWSSPLFHEIGHDPGSDFRIEGQFYSAHGKVAILIDAAPPRRYVPAPGRDATLQRLKDLGITQLLMMFNASDYHIMNRRLIAGDLAVVPQGLGSLTYNLLTSTHVYLQFRDRIRFDLVNYLH